MAAAFDYANGGSTNPGTSFSFNMTISSHDARLLMVVVAAASGLPAVTTVKFNGVDMTYWGQTVSRGRVYYMLQPPVGTYAVAISFSSSARYSAHGACFYNVDQATPFGSVVSTSSANNTDASGSIYLTTNDIGFDFCTGSSDPSQACNMAPSAGQTRRDIARGAGGGSGQGVATGISTIVPSSDGYMNLSWHRSGTEGVMRDLVLFPVRGIPVATSSFFVMF